MLKAENNLPNAALSICYFCLIHNAGSFSTGANLNDGQWHSVELVVRRGRLAVTLDKTDSSTASTSFPVAPDSQLFLGGKNNL